MSYCEGHGRDRERIEAEREASEAAERQAREDRRVAARGFVQVAQEHEALRLSKAVPGCEVVRAVRCACGEVVAFELFPDHYATCEGAQ